MSTAVEIFLILVFCITYTAAGLLVATFYANMYAFFNMSSPPAWKVYLVMAIWPVAVGNQFYRYIKQKLGFPI